MCPSCLHALTCSSRTASCMLFGPQVEAGAAFGYFLSSKKASLNIQLPHVAGRAVVVQQLALPSAGPVVICWNRIEGQHFCWVDLGSQVSAASMIFTTSPVDGWSIQIWDPHHLTNTPQSMERVLSLDIVFLVHPNNCQSPAHTMSCVRCY